MARNKFTRLPAGADYNTLLNQFNRLVDYVNQLGVIASPPLESMDLPGGTVLRIGKIPEEMKLGKLDGALAYGSSATCSIWTGTPNSETDSTVNETVYCWLLQSGETIAAATKVVIARIGGYWQVVATQCPPV